MHIETRHVDILLCVLLFLLGLQAGAWISVWVIAASVLPIFYFVLRRTWRIDLSTLVLGVTFWVLFGIGARFGYGVSFLICTFVCPFAYFAGRAFALGDVVHGERRLFSALFSFSIGALIEVSLDAIVSRDILSLREFTDFWTGAYENATNFNSRLLPLLLLSCALLFFVRHEWMRIVLVCTGGYILFLGYLTLTRTNFWLAFIALILTAVVGLVLMRRNGCRPSRRAWVTGASYFVIFSLCTVCIILYLQSKDSLFLKRMIQSAGEGLLPRIDIWQEIIRDMRD